MFSVLTPTWNRAHCLQELWNALQMQSCFSFEWIVGNDGSTDGTPAFIKSLVRHSGRDVVLIDAEKHVGKARIDNLMIAIARGDFCIWCDAGDVLRPDALSTLCRAWGAVENEGAENYVGIAALAESEGTPLGNYPVVEGFESRAFTLRNLERQVGADMVLAVRTSVLRSIPFPEVDIVIPESSVWSRLGGDLVCFVPRVLKTVVYGQGNAISGSGKMAYNRGRAYALGLERNTPSYSAGAMVEIRKAFNFIRYCAHGEISWHDAINLWGGSVSGRIILAAMCAPGLVMAGIDRVRGNVEKTHIEFNMALDSKVEVSQLSFSSSLGG